VSGTSDWMVLRWLLLAGVLGALAAVGHSAREAYACHPSRLLERRVNLDGDRTKEVVIAADDHDCGHTQFHAYVHVRDRCRGQWRTFDLQSDAEVLRDFRIANADGRTKRPEVFFVTQRVGPVASGIAEVVRLDDLPSGCARARALFRYTPTDAAVQSFDVQLKDVAPQFPGLEVVLTEGREVAQHITRYRYDRKRDRYVVYA
jgi:hypothetical protein